MEEGSSAIIGIRAVLLAAVGLCLALVVLAGVVWVFRDTRVAPAALLPATQTIAVIHLTDTQDLQRWKEILPELSGIPQVHQAVHLAVVESAPGKRGWVMLAADLRAPLGQTQEEGSTLGTEKIRAQDAETWRTTTAQTQRLDKEPSYHALAREMRGASWTYLSPQIAALAPLGVTQPIAVTTDAQGADHLLILSETDRGPGIPPTLSLLQPAASALVIRDAESLWQDLLTPLPRDLRLTAEGLLSTAVHRAVAPQASLRYDVLGAVRGPLTLEWLDTGSGSVVIAGQGLAEEPTAWLARMTSGQSRSETLDRLLDPERGFRLRAVRERTGSGTPVALQDEKNGWQVYSAPPLQLAVRAGGLRLTAGTEQPGNSLTDTPGASIPLPLPPGGQTLGGGLLQPASLRKLLPAGDALLQVLLPSLRQRGPLLWSLAWARGTRVISIQPWNSAVVTSGQTR